MTKLKNTTKPPDEKNPKYYRKQKRMTTTQNTMTELKSYHQITTKLPQPSYLQITTKLPPRYHHQITTKSPPSYYQITFSNGFGKWREGEEGGSWELTGQMCGPKHLWI